MSLPSFAQHIFRDDPTRPLSGCWQLDASRRVTLAGFHREITHADVVGFATPSFRATVQFDPRERRLVMRAPLGSGASVFTLRHGSGATAVLEEWRPDHRRMLAGFARTQSGPRHPLQVVNSFTLRRCPSL